MKGWRMTQGTQALIFDFDGLVLDTEISAFRSWQEIYREYQLDLPLEQWILCIGGTIAQFDAFAFLEQQVGRSLPRKEIEERRRLLHLAQLEAETALPGVEDTIRDARRAGLRIGLASNSPLSWVEGHLTRLGLHAHFDCIKTIEDVQHAKPQPDLYLAALDCLDVPAEQAIALEDSPNGVRAAQAAGIFCIAIPNQLTELLSLDHAGLRLKSLADMPLERLLAQVEEMRGVVRS